MKNITAAHDLLFKDDRPLNRDFSELVALAEIVSVASDSQSNASEMPEGKTYRDIVDALRLRICTAQVDELNKLYLIEELFDAAAAAMRDADARDALICLGSAAPLDAADERAVRVFRSTLGIDLADRHSWILDFDVQQLRRVMHHAVLPAVIERYESQRFARLKTAELSTMFAPSKAGLLRGTLNQLVEGASTSATCANQQPATSPRSSRALPLFHPWLLALSNLAITAPGQFDDLLGAYRDNDRKAFRSLSLWQDSAPVYLLFSSYSYPMGGGESYLHQTCRILAELGYRCVWVSFSDKGRLHARDSQAITPFFEEIMVAGGCTADTVRRLIERFKPDLIHCHGTVNDIVRAEAERLRIPTLLGYHFWSGLMTLGPSGNQNIRRDKAFLTAHDLRTESLPNFISYYVASEFMEEMYRAAGGRSHLEVLHPISDPAHYLVEEGAGDGTLVLQVNIVEHKGGKIGLACLEALGQEVPFGMVESEPGPEELFGAIKAAVANSPGSSYFRYGPIREHLRRARMVIVPTLVDETFCRVAFEAAANGIPVLSTDKGFLPQLLGDSGVFLSDDPNEWIAAIRSLYAEPEKAKELGRRQRERVLSEFGIFPKKFVASALTKTRESPHRNVGLFVPWSEQGLGEVARTYARVLERGGIRTHIFSYQAYAASRRGYALQKFPEDWLPGVAAHSVHYSYNDRETVTLNELIQFCYARNLGTFVYPEICFNINWQKIAHLTLPGLSVVNLPMLETVRAPEVLNHNWLDATWCCTRECKRVLQANGVTNLIYVGHGYGRPIARDAVQAKLDRLANREALVFRHFGGHNPVSRKQTGLVIAGFKLAAETRKDIELHVHVMGGFASGVKIEPHHQIHYHFETLSHQAVIEAYANSDVSIQVSSHEGLGLGFYESLATATPVISLNQAPHNEPVVDSVSGWLIPTTPFVLTDNNEALVKGGRIKAGDLAAMISSLSRSKIASAIVSTAGLHREQFSETAFADRLAVALRSGQTRMNGNWATP